MRVAGKYTYGKTCTQNMKKPSKPSNNIKKYKTGIGNQIP